MKLIKLLCILVLFVSSCKSKSERHKHYDLTPNKDSTWLIGKGSKPSRVADTSIYVIGGRELLPNKRISKDTVRRVVNKPYRIGDTAYLKYENRYYLVDYIDKSGY